MRDYVLLHVNGRRYEIRREMAFLSLTDFLRQELRQTGTKVVCAEGDCGACTVLVGRPDGDELRYDTVDACIQFLYQLDCTHVISVEGLQDDGKLHPVQQALIDHHGSQCGYCTPGFVMALAGLCERGEKIDADNLRIGLTGNLCRCTGYIPILEAAESIDLGLVPNLAQRYETREILEKINENVQVPVLLQCRSIGPSGWAVERTFFSPRRLKDAVEFKASHPEAVVVSGGTELGVQRNKQGYDPVSLLSLVWVSGLDEVTCSDESVVIGANATWTQLEQVAKELFPEFYQIIVRFGSPQIRNVATLVGNVAHGSPIADALPFLSVMDAELELLSPRGSRRVSINEFYKGYKQNDLAADELIVQVIVPRPCRGELLKLYKISRRNDLDIATFGAGIRIHTEDDVIVQAAISYSGVAPTVVRLPQVEALLRGRPFSADTFQEAGRRARSEIRPISDVRGSADFRLLLAENILLKFYHDVTNALSGKVDRA